MSGAAVSPAPESQGSPARSERRLSRRQLLRAVLALVVLAAAAAVTATLRLGLVPRALNPFAPPAPTGTGGNGASTSLTTVVRRDLSSQTQANGTLGYAGAYTVVNQAHGTITSLPAIGQVFSQGQALYEVDGAPVMLLYGSTPAYRDLSAGATAADVTGPDVRELNADVVALGYVAGSELSPTSNQFSSWTEVGVKRLQAAMGVDQTGTLTLGQVVFLPGAVRITAVQGTLGATAGPGQMLLTASSTTRQVTVNLDAAQQSELAVGNQVGISLPNGKSTAGTVTSVGSVASPGSGGGSPTVQVLITPTDASATGSLDAAPVNVTITTQTVRNALVVPVAALLARPDGTYVVEVVNDRGVHHLVAVNLGLFDDADGQVQVTDTQLRAGQRVVVPSS